MLNTVSSSLSSIETYVSSSWAAGVHNAVEVFYSNESLAPPDDSPWVEFGIIWGSTNQLTKNGTRTMTNTANVNVYTPKGTGQVSGSLLTDAWRELFASASLTDIRFEPAGGPTDVPQDSKWRQQNIQAIFTVDEQAP